MFWACPNLQYFLLKLFADDGVVMPDQRKKTNVKCTKDVVDSAKNVNDYPQFYLEELQEDLIDKFKSKYPKLPVSIPTLCRALTRPKAD